MARKLTTSSQEQLLDQILSNLTATIKDLCPQAEVEITFEQFEDEDAHVYVHPPADLTEEEVDRLEVAVGEHCNEILLETGFFIVSAVCD